MHCHCQGNPFSIYDLNTALAAGYGVICVNTYIEMSFYLELLSLLCHAFMFI